MSQTLQKKNHQPCTANSTFCTCTLYLILIVYRGITLSIQNIASNGQSPVCHTILYARNTVLSEAVLAESHRGWQLVRREWRFPPISPAFVAHMPSNWRAIVFWLARRQRSTVATVYYWLQGSELAECKPEKGPHHVFFSESSDTKASDDSFGVLRVVQNIDGETDPGVGLSRSIYC